MTSVTLASNYTGYFVISMRHCLECEVLALIPSKFIPNLYSKFIFSFKARRINFHVMPNDCVEETNKIVKALQRILPSLKFCSKLLENILHNSKQGYRNTIEGLFQFSRSKKKLINSALLKTEF